MTFPQSPALERMPRLGVIPPAGGILSRSYNHAHTHPDIGMLDVEMRVSMHLDEEFTPTDSYECDCADENEPPCIEPTTDASAPAVTSPSLAPQESDFSFGRATYEPDRTPSPMFERESTPELFPRSHSKVPKSVSPCLLSHYGRAKRVPTPPVDIAESIDNKMKNMDISQESSKADGQHEAEGPRRSPRIQRKQASYSTETSTPKVEQHGEASSSMKRYMTRSATKTLMASGKKSSSPSARSLKLSPTEQEIRDSLRRSRRGRSSLSPHNQ